MSRLRALRAFGRFNVTLMSPPSRDISTGASAAAVVSSRAWELIAATAREPWESMLTMKSAATSLAPQFPGGHPQP
jgi:hypothetical protein